MNHFEEAVKSKRSTILYGTFGRNPRLVKFYLSAIPELSSASQFELILWHRNRRLLNVFLEPPFDAVVPPDRWCLVLTSHLRLRWDPLSTRVVDTHLPLYRQIPMPENVTRDHTRLVPPTSHIFAFFGPRPYRVDLSGITDTHEAYLRLLTFFDVLRPSSEWSLSISEKLRLQLLKDIPGTGPYDAHLLKALGW